jgi:hypothetical protein
MKPAWWMAGLGVLSWLVVAALPNVESDTEILLGMIAPLAAALGTWVMVVRMSSRPQLLTSLMIGAFGAKMVFFGVYVVIMLKVLEVRPLPFIISFTCYFIGLHLFEALCLQRFFAANTPAHQ